jgi:hypothetical protein
MCEPLYPVLQRFGANALDVIENKKSASSEIAGLTRPEPMPEQDCFLLLRFGRTRARRAPFSPTGWQFFHAQRFDCRTMNDLPAG